jgi:fibronectin type 3 domain-containing protein
VITRSARTADGVALRWTATDRKTTSYAVYRVPGRYDRCALVDGRHLVATVRSKSFVDTTAAAGERYTYVVTALDRTHNESRASLPRVVR